MSKTFTSIFHEAVIPLNEGLFSKKNIPDSFYKDGEKICKIVNPKISFEKESRKKSTKLCANELDTNLTFKQIENHMKSCGLTQVGRERVYMSTNFTVSKREALYRKGDEYYVYIVSGSEDKDTDKMEMIIIAIYYVKGKKLNDEDFYKYFS